MKNVLFITTVLVLVFSLDPNGVAKADSHRHFASPIRMPQSEGGAHGGGGLGVGNNLLDLYEQGGLGLEPFEPTQSQIFKEDLKKRIEDLDQRIPGVAGIILAGFKEKKWFLTEHEITESGDSCLLVKVNTSQIARQNDKEVVISKSWLESSEVSLVNKSALLLHELFMARYMKLHGAPDCSKSIRSAVMLVFNDAQASDEELRDNLDNLGFVRRLLTRGEVTKISTALQPIIEFSCDSTHADLSEKNLKAIKVLVRNFFNTRDLFAALNRSEDVYDYPELHNRPGNVLMDSVTNILFKIEDFEAGNRTYFHNNMSYVCRDYKSWISLHTSNY